MVEIRGPKKIMKNEIFQFFFLQIRTQRYTAEFKNDIIFHVGPLDEKLEVFKKYSGVPDECPPKQSVTPVCLHHHQM